MQYAFFVYILLYVLCVVWYWSNLYLTPIKNLNLNLVPFVSHVLHWKPYTNKVVEFEFGAFREPCSALKLCMQHHTVTDCYNGSV